MSQCLLYDHEVLKNYLHKRHVFKVHLNKYFVKPHRHMEPRKPPLKWTDDQQFSGLQRAHRHYPLEDVRVSIDARNWVLPNIMIANQFFYFSSIKLENYK